MQSSTTIHYRNWGYYQIADDDKKRSAEQRIINILSHVQCKRDGESERAPTRSLATAFEL